MVSGINSGMNDGTHRGEGLEAALGRIAAEEMRLAMQELSRRDHAESIHSVRKSIKRLRALLRSLRVTFPKNLYRSENRRLAEAGRKISPLRDVHVQLRTLGKLRGCRGRVAAGVRRDLRSQEQKFLRKMPELRKAVRAMLGRSRGTMDSWPLGRTTPASLETGLKRIYKQGRAAFKTALRNPSPERLHEWRKKVKALGFGLELVGRLAPRKISKELPDCRELGDVLGANHDLFMVLEALRSANSLSRKTDYKRLARRISTKRAKLRRRSLKLGRKIYKEKPRAFAKHLDQVMAGLKPKSRS